MAVHPWLVTLALAALLIVNREVPVSAGRIVFTRVPICDHMAETPDCSQSVHPVCGTDGITYDSECQLCLVRIKTKQNIQIVKDSTC